METSGSGAPIYRHKPKESETFTPPSGDSRLEEITAHIEKYVGKIDMVWHEIISEHVHIDIHVINPTQEKPFYTLVTSGMSDLPMNVPEGCEKLRYSELCLSLPSTWQMGQEPFKDENNYWPLRWLKILSRFPHQFDTWLCHGHTVPNGDPAEPFVAGTSLNTMMLLQPVLHDEQFATLELEEKVIHFYSLIPLYTEEVNLKLDKGVEALYDGFDRIGLTELLDIQRPNSVKKKKFWGLF